MMDMRNLKGSISAPTTSFPIDGTVNFDALRALPDEADLLV